MAKSSFAGLLAAVLLATNLSGTLAAPNQKRQAPNFKSPPRTKERVKRQTIPEGTARGGQPTKQIPDDLVGGFEHVVDTGVSAMMMFLGTSDKVYILDKVENNALRVGDHPAWAVEYDLNTNEIRTQDIETNAFCAGGGQLADGRWINVGGNQAVEPTNDGTGDVRDAVNQAGDNAYGSWDGRNVTRILLPGDGSEWSVDFADNMASRRWYPTVATMADGRAVIIGGNIVGGFVNNPETNNPTYEFFPRINDGDTETRMPFLERTLPANLYVIADLLPSGNLVINANQDTIVFDPYTNNEVAVLPRIPKAIRTYPASAATSMMPIKATEGYRATVMYCGGSDIAPDQWTDGVSELINIAASASCVKITADDENAQWEDDEDMPEGRVMGNGILLPDGKFLVVNGANTGVAGYSMSAPWAFQNSLANTPVLDPVIYDPDRPLGERWSRDGLRGSDIARMYHSVATLLPDGSVLVAGSNPHPDVSLTSDFPTEYRAERFYPPYFNSPRPSPELPTRISYGGDYFDISLSLDDLAGNRGNVMRTKAILIKTGFSTHGINFGQRFVELDVSWSNNGDDGMILHVSPPPAPTIIQPGVAWFFVVVDGIPSVGVPVMIGSGNIEDQPVAEMEPLPESEEVEDDPNAGGNGGDGGSSGSGATSVVASNGLFTKAFSALAVVAVAACWW